MIQKIEKITAFSFRPEDRKNWKNFENLFK